MPSIDGAYMLSNKQNLPFARFLVLQTLIKLGQIIQLEIINQTNSTFILELGHQIVTVHEVIFFPATNQFF